MLVYKEKREGFWPSPFFLSSQNSASGNESAELLELGVFHGESNVFFKNPLAQPLANRLALYLPEC
jgi:hypothetical protein